MPQSNLILFDAGLFIAALLNGDSRHLEARPLVEVARNRGVNRVYHREYPKRSLCRIDLGKCTTTSPS